MDKWIRIGGLPDERGGMATFSLHRCHREQYHSVMLNQPGLEVGRSIIRGIPESVRHGR
jgi:hypothetical protein